ncbi:MAG: rhomboid family intramembrane serine protease [Oscillospiraceae bacterium]
MPKTNSSKKLSYNSPVILTYAAVCLAVLILNKITGGFTNRLLFVCYGHPSLLDPLTYPRLILHALGHVDFSHFANNMIMLMLMGPIVEERYGSWNLIVMMTVTALVTGILNSLLFSTGIIGASGIVFMLIILSAFTSMKKGEIPITLIIVTAIYLGQEVYSGLTLNDGISHFGHITGGVCGLLFGMYFYKKKFERTY